MAALVLPHVLSHAEAAGCARMLAQAIGASSEPLAVVDASALEQTLTTPGDNNAFNHLTRVQRYIRGLERSALQALALLHQSYADRCAAVDLQDLVTHAHNSPIVIPAAAPISRLLQPSSFQTTTKDSALRITYVEQGRLSRESRPS